MTGTGTKKGVVTDPKGLFDNPVLSTLCARDIECQVYERKSKREPKQIAQTVSAFANSNVDRGGLIAVGISDDGVLDGLHHRPDVNVNSILSYQQQAGVQTQHRLVDCTNAGGADDQVLLIFVPYVRDRVVETSDWRAFVRNGDKTVELHYNERRQLEHQKGQVSFEDETACPYDASTVEEDVVEEFVSSVVRKDRLGGQQRREDILQSRSLLRYENGTPRLTNAGLLLLGKAPTERLPGAYVRFRRFDGREKKTGAQHNVVKDETFVGPLPRLMLRLAEFLRTQVREFSRLGENGRFTNEPEYPEFAWTEAVVNALVHRTYSQMNSPVFVEMYEDRLEVTSPGDYPAGVSPDAFFHNPVNPHLMGGMLYLDFVKMAAEGVHRIRDEMTRAELPPPEYSPKGEPRVRVVLRNAIDKRQMTWSQAAVGQLTEFSNLHPLRVVSSPTETKDGWQGGGMRPGLLADALLGSLKEHGWTSDGFSLDRAIDKQREYKGGGLEQFASVCPGFHFRFRQFRRDWFLCLDPSVEVRSKVRLGELRRVLPAVASRGFRKGYAKIDGKWGPCEVIEMAAAGAKVAPARGTGPAADVVEDAFVPVLRPDLLADYLARAGVRVGLYQVIRGMSFSAGEHAARSRAQQTQQLADWLRAEVFPLRVGDVTIELETKPAGLSESFAVHDDLLDAEPVFNKENPQKAARIIEGLTAHGAYDRPGAEVSLVTLCTADVAEQMQTLVKTIEKGSARYPGLARTFSLSFSPIRAHIAPSCDDYLDACKELVGKVPEKSVFLVYCPEEGYSRADYAGPYYRTKHFLLQAGFASQMVDEATLRDPRFKDFNLALDIFAKSGHIPWVLCEGMPNSDLFIGLSYSTVGTGTERDRVLAYANVFDRYGRWLYYRGNAEPVRFEDRNSAFRDILGGIAQEYETRARLQKLHIHHGFRLSGEGRKEIVGGVHHHCPGAEISFVYVNARSNMRLYDGRAEGDGTLKRGRYVVLGPRHFAMSTTGQNEYGERGIGTPRVLEVEVENWGSQAPLDLRVYAQHILSLTRLNWASTRSFCREPITLKFAGDIAYLMAAFLHGLGGFRLHRRLEGTPWFL
jgi:predicted HTH transcriptional regulator